MKIVENIPLVSHSAFAVGGTAQFGGEIHNTEDIAELVSFAKAQNLPIHICGEGTNTLFSEGAHHVVLGIMKYSGVTIMAETDEYIDVQFAGGESWDACVAWAVARNLSGIEALSSIPGTAGAAPIQNIGAYGAEFKDHCTSVEVYDVATETFQTMSSEQCMFTYRDSIFKQHPGRYIVISITLRLLKSPPTIPQYKDVIAYFSDNPTPTLAEIRDAIITIRAAKLPDYRAIPNVGSYFKNPIISEGALKQLLETHPDIPHTPFDTGGAKLYAGWLIEQAGFKGKTIHDITVYEKNALILTNPHRAPQTALAQAEAEIIGGVHHMFGVTLEREPVLVKAEQ
jgi:UDP-N-acetylmuramate dehydrogenase